MKKVLAVLILFLGALCLFAEDGTLKRHNFFVGVADFFVYDGMHGLVTYGYGLDPNDLVKASFDFGYHESNQYEWKYNDSTPDQISWSASIGWQRYFTGQRLRPYAGIGARYSYYHTEVRHSTEKTQEDTERKVSITVPLGVDFALSESIGIGLETEILFSRRYFEWDYQYEFDDPDTGDFMEYSVEPGDYRFYIVFRF